RAGPRPRAARGVRAAVGDRADLPAPAGRRDQLDDAGRHGRRADVRGTPGRGSREGRRRPMTATGGEGAWPAPPPADRIEVRIAPMRRRHLRGVLRIEQQVYPRPWTAGLFLSEIGQRSTRAYLIARVGGEIVGYAGMLRSLDDGHITTVAVDPAWQRRGIATRLLLALARAAIDRGCLSLTLEVRMSNSGAQALYQRFGFVPAGV